MKILLFCRYDESGASSRFRSFQYLPYLRRLLGKKIDVVMRNAALVIAGNEYFADRA